MSNYIDPDTLTAARLCVRAWSGEREDGYQIEGPEWDVEDIVAHMGEAIASLDRTSRALCSLLGTTQAELDQCFELGDRPQYMAEAVRSRRKMNPPTLRHVTRRDSPDAIAREVIEDRGETLVLRFGPNGCGRQVVRAADYNEAP